jgi:hypothetical protein
MLSTSDDPKLEAYKSFKDLFDKSTIELIKSCQKNDIF